jgi:hypothetical protein
LSDYRIVTINVTREEIASLIRENFYVKPNKGRWDDDVEAAMLASAVALRKAFNKYRFQHAMSFHSSIARAKAFKASQDVLTEAFSRYGDLETFHVSGAMPTGKRKHHIEDFEHSHRALITNARCLTEGVDVPNIDCVLFADPRKSKIDIIQAVGRALRPAEGKDIGYVVIPVLINDQIGTDVMTQSGDFDVVLSTLRALAANDDRIIEYFRSISKRQKPRRDNSPVDIDLPLGLEIDAEDFINSIELRFWSKLAKLSWRPFTDARNFVRGLDLKSRSEWNMFCKGKLSEKGLKPDDIPNYPSKVYKDKGWGGWGDWLGTGTIAKFLREYKLFQQAREFARSLDLESNSDWRRFSKGELPEKGTKPDDIPAQPDHTYKGKGWVSWGDWLGTGRIAAQFKKYIPFHQAREFARSLGLKSLSDWKRFCKGGLPDKGKKTDDIPVNPETTYKDKGWINWGDWLGTGRIATNIRDYRPFQQARKLARSLGIKSWDEWRRFCKGELSEKGYKPDDIPSAPNRIYKDKGWINWGDWLGTGRIADQFKEYRPFQQARGFARSLGLKTVSEWRKFCKGEFPDKGINSDDIPSAPHIVYKHKGWVNWGDWLGTGRIATNIRKYRSYQKAQTFVRDLSLNSHSEWRSYCKGELPDKGVRPADIPNAPNQVYKGKGWVSWNDWLGPRKAVSHISKYMPFQQAREFARNVSLKSRSEWQVFCKGGLPDKGVKPDDIPNAPHIVYKDRGWGGWGDWLGTGRIASFLKEYSSFQQAREFARSLDLESNSDWRRFLKGELPDKGTKPDDIPAQPSKTYKGKGWVNWGDWLGTGRIAAQFKEFRPFQQARGFARSLGLKSLSDWKRFCKGGLPDKGVKPDDIPSAPQMVYKDKGWTSWGDWLGTGRIATNLREYKSFEKAREFARSLGIKSASEWQRFSKGELVDKVVKPNDIPSAPYMVYKGKGWTSWADWLGKTTNHYQI